MTRQGRREYLATKAVNQLTVSSGDTGSRLLDCLWVRLTSYEERNPKWRVHAWFRTWILDIVLPYLGNRTIIRLSNCLGWCNRVELFIRPFMATFRTTANLQEWRVREWLRVTNLVRNFFLSYGPYCVHSERHGFGFEDVCRHFPRMERCLMRMATTYLEEEGYIFSTVGDHYLAVESVEKSR